MTELLQAQLGDVFRIGLIIGLIITAARTRAVTGIALPLAAGVVFIAAIIPLTTSTAVDAPFWMQVASGVIANLILLGIGLGIWTLVDRLRATKG
jgi:hypothetical protein